jgi:hypothetical protein
VEQRGEDPQFARTLLGWVRNRAGVLVPGTADVASPTSVAIAAQVLDVLGVARGLELSGTGATGRGLELAIARDLSTALMADFPGRGLIVHPEPRVVTEFSQYAHLRRVEELAATSADLRTTLGADYIIKPDVVVSLPGRDEGDLRLLHAVISCKWTIRSDRVQNIRHEYNQLIRHRRERLPHLVTVTAEPLPTRIAAITRGTGEVDATYHVAFHALEASLRELRLLGRISAEQLDAWDEAVSQGRLRPYSQLATTLGSW